MRKTLLWLTLAGVCMPGPARAADNIVPLVSSGTLAISEVSLRETHVARYETVEITFRMEGRWQNPFDPNEVRVDFNIMERVVTVGRLTLRGVPDGKWNAQWTDTVEARLVGQETVISKDRNMVLKTPPITKSVVARLQLAH